MITVKLLGGLGNQMFQFAYGAALVKRGYDVQFDKSALVEGTHREYSLEYFDPNIPFGVPSGPTITEKSMRFDIEKLHPEDPATMLGYWQTEKYFQEVESEVRRFFKFDNPYLLRQSRKTVADVWDMIYRSDSIAVHVRRQDYVRLQHFHGMPFVNYYLDGVDYIRERRPATKVFVFSDDAAWCREALPGDWHIVRETNKYEDLRLMSSCNHAVIANSSFSWWGAWLQQKLGGIVVAPKQWFVDPDVDYSDVVPDRWVKL